MPPIPTPAPEQTQAGAGPPAWPGGRVIGRYRLGPRLGKGGMGEVFEAWDGLLGRRVALKTLNVPSASAILRFMREAQLQARVSHPNVCRIYDVDASGEVPVIAMQLVEGPNLQQAAADLTVVQAVEILGAVAMAINAAHRLNLIHRDLKPGNILLENDGMGGWTTYVADFGLAKDLAAVGCTETQVVMGTPEFIAPELHGDGSGVGPATDIYALGVTLQTVAGLCRGDGSPGPGGGRALPRRLRLIIARCLEERPQDRYHSAGELAEDLRRVLDGETLLAERGEWRRGLRRFIRRHPTWTVSLGLVLLLGTSFLGWTSHLAARSHRQAALAQRFALEARDLENRLRVERLIPAHDLRPAHAQLQEGLDRIRKEMERLGPVALGPGNLALGRGYCYLGDLEQARRVLTTAWQGGYRTPDVAYALGWVACFSYFRLLDRAEMGDLEDPLEPALQVHLQAARTYGALSRGQSWEPAGLGESRLFYLEGKFEASVRQAQAAFKEHPWLYEAKMQEAFSLGALAWACQTRGELGRAQSLYREAGLAAQAAQAIGQSDGNCALADMEWRLHWVQLPGLGGPERMGQLDQAERQADHLLALQPDSPRALCSKAFVLIRRAAALAAQGLSPEPELQRAERLLAPAAERPAFQRMVTLKRRQIQDVRGN
ncbi:MAG: serine/threonine-protein kinase [Holophaga sp.]|nr:serine/threonine-protein kinase [Holophaga sp.]